MKILMLSSTFPYPPTLGGTQVRTFNLLKYLSQRHEITLVTQKGEDVTDAQIEDLQKWVTELVIFPRPPEMPGGILQKTRRFSKFWQQGTPPNVLSVYSAKIQQWIDAEISANKFDVLTCEHSVNEIYVRPQWQHQLRTVINIHSSPYRTCENQLAIKTSENPWRDRLYLPLLKRYERQLCRKFSQIVVTTQDDLQQFKTFNYETETKIAVIPNGVDLELFPYRQVDPGEYRLIITGGMDYNINIDAACFFSVEILPILQRKYPNATLTIVGSKPSLEVLALAKRPGINVTGRVSSMAKYLHQATICVVPLRSGFGIKNKTLEAMAAGVPVVASDRGLEGLAVDTPGFPLRALRANRVEEYVTAISRLFEDAKLRKTLSQNGRELIEKEYTWEQAGKSYERAISAS